MWQVLRVYGVGGKLLKAVQYFYVDTRACVRLGMNVSKWFQKVTDRVVWCLHGCLMCIWMV